MGQPLWAPWRMEYVLSSKRGEGCIFCGVAHLDTSEVTARRERLVVMSNSHAFVMLNRYPFAPGHLLVVPHAHVSRLDELDETTYDALFRLVREAARRLGAAVGPQGLNVGLNLGEAAGAGVAEHLHAHVVPRWAGDSNFMPVVADTRVVPQALDATLAHLTPYFADIDGPKP